MIVLPSVRKLHVIALCSALITVLGTQVFSAQTISATAELRPITQRNRIAANPDLTPQIKLTGNVPAWAKPSAQAASRSVDLSSPLHVFVVLRRDSAAQAAFDKLTAAQQDRSSPLYHQWLTPQQVGELYGPTESDVAAVSSWLSAQGLTVLPVGPTRLAVEATGPAAVVASAFRTNFGYYNFGGEAHFSASQEPSVPSAFSAVIASIGGLTEELLAPQHAKTVVYRPDFVAAATGGFNPQPELNGGSGTHFLTPADFATIYNISPVYAAGNKGGTVGATAQHVAIVGRSRVTASDISTYASITAIGTYTLNQTVPTGGIDPGVTNTGDQDEATLDVDRVIGTAPGAVVDLLISTNAGGGIAAGLNYNVNTLIDPVMTISFGACETAAGSSTVSQYDAFFQAAASEGISTFVSSGDSGVAGCATAFVNPPTSTSANINFLCSSSYVTCVGGTEFNDTANPATYWSASSGSASGYGTALSYIPEGAWNEPTTSGTSSGYQLSATGGGPSQFISKPTWQTGTGVPADGKRDTPDISFAAASHDGYFACLDYALSAGHTCAGGYFLDFSGTSASAPGMAGITALLNTKLGKTQGNLNPLLYKLAASNAAAFHDSTPASSGVSTCAVTTASMCNNTTPSSTGLTGGVTGFALTTGYDEATGLGSLDVSAFITAAVSATAGTSTTLTVTAAPNPATTNQTVTLTATLTPAAGGTGTPTGTVTFYSNGAAIGSAVTLSGNVATTTTTFSATGTYSITAVYSGDASYNPSTATAYSLVVNSAPSFSVTPTTTSLALISGAATANTDTITLASLNGFVGGVTLTCTVTTASGSAAGTCGLAPGSVTLTSGGNASSVLTISTTPGTSGALNVTVTGTSGSTTVTSSNIVVTLTASSYTMAAVPPSLNLTSGATTGNTSIVTLTSVNGFTGTVAITCTAAKTSGTAAGTCAASPASITVPANGTATSTITLTSTAGTSGGLTLTVSGSGAPTGGTIAATASTTITATLITPTFTLSASPATLTLVSGATAGNSSVVTLTSSNSFAGSVALSCSVSSGSAYYPPTCSVTPTVNLTAAGTASATVTIGSTTTVQAANHMPGLFGTGGVVMAAVLLLVPGFRRRKPTALMALLLAGAGLFSMTGCGGGGTPAATPTYHSSAGSYVVTITGQGTPAGGSNVTASTTFNVNISQ